MQCVLLLDDLQYKNIEITNQIIIIYALNNIISQKKVKNALFNRPKLSMQLSNKKKGLIHNFLKSLFFILLQINWAWLLLYAKKETQIICFRMQFLHPLLYIFEHSLFSFCQQGVKLHIKNQICLKNCTIGRRHLIITKVNFTQGVPRNMKIARRLESCLELLIDQ